MLKGLTIWHWLIPALVTLFISFTSTAVGYGMLQSNGKATESRVTTLESKTDGLGSSSAANTQELKDLHQDVKEIQKDIKELLRRR
jgi:peptidoglycan hydrolase CwlO-like protein